MSGTLARYAAANLRAVTAWAIVAPLAVALTYFAVRLVLARVRLPTAVGAER